jgi:hypothetical protein
VAVRRKVIGKKVVVKGTIAAVVKEDIRVIAVAVEDTLR